IATKADQVVDVFYVRDFDGQKADSPEQVAAIKASIEKVIGISENSPSEKPDTETIRKKKLAKKGIMADAVCDNLMAAAKLIPR
ncbi:MAG: hypothetical protein HC887_00915, partial [Desulfobacteraceae bacterium]|nr:hypothetical protein [Desulfobacteraceae bacterium]